MTSPGLAVKDVLRETPREEVDPLERAAGFLVDVQQADGSWKGDYGGAFFLTPLWSCGLVAMGVDPGTGTAAGFVRHITAHQNEDGGWGLHVESPSDMFTTTLGHVALRLMGAEPDDPIVSRSRRWIRSHGGAAGVPLWGKLFLATLGLYHWDGVPPLTPELWLLPPSSPLCPGRIWCHARVVLLAMSHLYGRRFSVPATWLTRKIREEIHDGPYDTTHWPSRRNRVCETDRNTSIGLVSRSASALLGLYEKMHGRILRERALATTLDHIKHEDESTDHIDIGPVNKLLNMMVAWFEDGPGSPWFSKHLEHVPDYLWETTEGVHVNGYNSTSLWDTAFVVQALCAGGSPRHRGTLERAHGFIESNQVLEDATDHERYYRHASCGGWPFSNRPHGWPISDCTGEGLKAALLLQRHVANPIPYERLRAAVELILSLQNGDGGWATYERTRASPLLEKLNSSSLFADIMVDYSYPECTSSCLQALRAFRDRYPGRLATRVEIAISAGRDYLLATQRPDGSWYGSWGVCFTYGTWFGTWGLRAAGLEPDHAALERASGFLLGHQNRDGGWGEHWRSCTEMRYVPSAASQVVMTCWALLALLACRSDPEAIQRGVDHIVRRQLPSGDWPREPIEGVFNKTCMIRYDNYRNIFPVWVLGLRGAPLTGLRSG